jgi:hypothetical protein
MVPVIAKTRFSDYATATNPNPCVRSLMVKHLTQFLDILVFPSLAHLLVLLGKKILKFEFLVKVQVKF